MPVVNEEQNWQRCLCGRCPSFSECAQERGEGLYCGVGKSECISETLGCLCAQCPVSKHSQLCASYYCLHGEAP